jgi:monofunctional biosynthetic peptidoglycan transglycosylase
MGESLTDAPPPSPTRRFRVAGMSCDGCAERVELALRSVPGVEGAVVDLDRAEVLLRAASDVPDDMLADAVEQAGYTLVLAPEDETAHPSLAEPEPDPEPPAPAPEPAPEPAPPAPEPEPVRQSPIYGDADEYRDPAERSWIPSLATIWFVGVRVVFAALIFSLAWVLLYRFVPPPFTLVMVGDTIWEGRAPRQTWVPLERISPHLVRSVIASEDDDFCNHYGFDFKELQAAWERAQDGDRLRGASTISQQTAKNAFLWGGRSYLRKGLEAYFTVLIETFWPKRRIMEVYLNVIEWGPGIFGAEAASRHWFGKSASRLSAMEAARLAAILPAPKRYRASPAGPYVNGRGYTIAARANYSDDRCIRR